MNTVMMLLRWGSLARPLTLRPNTGCYEGRISKEWTLRVRELTSGPWEASLSTEGLPVSSLAARGDTPQVAVDALREIALTIPKEIIDSILIVKWGDKWLELHAEKQSTRRWAAKLGCWELALWQYPSGGWDMSLTNTRPDMTVLQIMSGKRPGKDEWLSAQAAVDSAREALGNLLSPAL